jgi:NAD(P)-dependent dehydrogenase (short-subunit alcohol dehydrogenase family)
MEVMIVNCISPFMLISKLKGCMEGNSPLRQGNQQPKFIVNVTSSEGIFHLMKNSKHPHTNMAKASLNMLTKTIAMDFAQQQIYVSCVDTGWVSKLAPLPMQDSSRKIPLTVEDGAARVLDPIFSGSL